MNSFKTLTIAAAGAALAACAVLAVLGASKAAPGPAASVPAKAALTVTSARPLAATLPLTLAANGNVAPWQEASISSESNGLRLTEVRVNVGEAVRAGQVLAVFASEAVAADLAQAQAALAEAQANAVDTASNAERARSLRAAGMVSAQQLSQAQTAAQVADARTAQARATLASQQLRMKYTQVTAPDAGLVSARSATVGAVPASGTELFRMIRQGRLEWRAEVAAAEVGALKAGANARVRAPDGSEATGQVRMVAPTVDPQTRTALVYVDLPPAQGGSAAFKAGMFASGRFELGTSPALTLPQQAVVLRDGFSYVFKLGANARVSRQKVETGRRLQDRIEIVTGVQADTVVAVDGAGFLNDGDLVRSAPAAEQAKR
ncbi:MAG: efflux RND transporter periplasmic adaptor subunit [Pseudomonadota bacterium]